VPEENRGSGPEIIPPSQPGRSQNGQFGKDEFRELVGLERERVDSANKRTAVFEKMVEAQARESQLEYDYQVKALELDEKRLEYADNADRRRISIAKTAFWSVFLLFMIIILTVFYFAFLGTEEQARIATLIIAVIGIALGGAGVFNVLKSMFGFLIARDS
jgi:hypothetical protein